MVSALRGRKCAIRISIVTREEDGIDTFDLTFSRSDLKTISKIAGNSPNGFLGSLILNTRDTMLDLGKVPHTQIDYLMGSVDDEAKLSDSVKHFIEVCRIIFVEDVNIICTDFRMTEVSLD